MLEQRVIFAGLLISSTNIKKEPKGTTDFEGALF